MRLINTLDSCHSDSEFGVAPVQRYVVEVVIKVHNFLVVSGCHYSFHNLVLVTFLRNLNLLEGRSKSSNSEAINFGSLQVLNILIFAIFNLYHTDRKPNSIMAAFDNLNLIGNSLSNGR